MAKSKYSVDCFQALSDPNRREILMMLTKEKQNINAIADNFNISRPAVSKHIKVLYDSGFITITTQGRERYCELQQQGFDELKEWISFFETYWTKQLKQQVLLVHPGGPFFAKKDAGSWTIPKGEYPESEAPLDAAIREFEEETGYRPSGRFIPLQAIKQKGGKVVQCWAVSGELDPAGIVSNTFELEWPPRSGKKRSYPEVDKAAWFTLAEARQMMNERQTAFLDELETLL